MANHKFKAGQYYVRKWKPLTYKVCPCNTGTMAVNMMKGNCSKCKVLLMLWCTENDPKEKIGYCCKTLIHTPSLRKLTRAEVILKDF